ncbi:DUF4198 domain-containing protein [Litorisediminicola beolgyonensis]|uniref:DUF4198 domain-containing protein n=1 Tax=Litorisediminicola beolgyonensis TaxID=1173614 RepID=A0ABW3ZEV6_9RHOB
MSARYILAALLAFAAAPLSAHEFWISPVDYTVAPSAPAVADLRVGENFKGAAFSFLPPNFVRFDLAMGDTVVAVEGRPGDRPALNMVPPDAEGLLTVIHETRAYDLTYDSVENFESFVRHKDAEWAVARRVERGLADEPVRESYIRYAKSLIAIGDGGGMDQDRGLLIEIVAEANPYTIDPADGLPVQVLFEGAPRADAQIELFAKSPDGTVEVTLHRTDGEGRVTIPVAPGHQYLVDSVVLRESDPAETNGAEWESLWASLTFEVPE